MQLASCGACFPRKKQKTAVLGVNWPYSWSKPFVACLPGTAWPVVESEVKLAGGCDEQESLQMCETLP